MAGLELTVNGRSVQVVAPNTTPLLDVLRNQLGLMGTRYGCGLEQCGSCIVLLDGEPVSPADDLRQARELALLFCKSEQAIETFIEHTAMLPPVIC